MIWLSKRRTDSWQPRCGITAGRVASLFAVLCNFCSRTTGVSPASSRTTGVSPATSRTTGVSPASSSTTGVSPATSRAAGRFAVLFTFCTLIGCNTGSSSSTMRSTGWTNPPAAKPTKVVAQGQILPANGLIRLSATPGDTVEQLSVKVGDRVVAGQQLVTMRSFKLHAARVESLENRYQEAQRLKANAIEQAGHRVAAAETKRQQIELQSQAFARQEVLLQLAKNQVAASEKIFARLQSIGQDPLTSNFVGAMQLDQQRLAVDEAQLSYRQQVETLQQARDAAGASARGADLEWKAAQSALEAAEKSLALEALESEKKALQLQQQASFVIAPQDAIVVAINTRVGEATAQFPLVELADVSQAMCEAEVVETDAAYIEPGQAVSISSPALTQTLRGKVIRRSQLVGRPQLALADPLAKVDYRSTNITIGIDPADAPLATQWLQLQVNVVIDIGGDDSFSNQSPSEQTAAPL